MMDAASTRSRFAARCSNAAGSTRRPPPRFTDAELLDFVFVPGFTTAASVTEISGRGVGLDAVRTVLKSFGGSVKLTSEPGRGCQFLLQMPITLSVMRVVLASVGGETFAFPLNRTAYLASVEREDLIAVEGWPAFERGGRFVGLCDGRELFGLPPDLRSADEQRVLVVTDGQAEFGLTVDRFEAETDLVVRPLDPRLGRVPNVAAAAILDDGSPVLIVDADDLVSAMQSRRFGPARVVAHAPSLPARKRSILVVEDSLTIRELERQLLEREGYEVETAADGLIGLEAAMARPFDLVVSDIDMPRMTGLEMIQRMRSEARLSRLPVVVVSYKDREEDRMAGLQAGADAYLTKSSFHDNGFLDTVADLIGDGPLTIGH